MKYVTIKVDLLLIISIILSSIGSMELLERSLFQLSITHLLFGNIVILNLAAFVSIALAGVYMLYQLFLMIRLPNER